MVDVYHNVEEAQETKQASPEKAKSETERPKDLSEHALPSTFEQHLVPSPAFRSK